MCSRSRVASRPTNSFILPLSLLFCIALQQSLNVCASQAAPPPARWTPPTNWGAIAVHMALIPGYGSPFHSKILWWDEDSPNGFQGGQWGWTDPGSIDCTSYPSAAFANLGLPNPGANLFCAGFAPLGDGRLCVVGGTEEGGESGMKHTYLFNPGTGAGGQGAWVQGDSMQARRWYPSVTILNDGRVLATSGSASPQLEIFGGRINTNTLPADRNLYRYNAVAFGETAATVAQGGSPFWPPPLLAQTAVSSPLNGNVIYYGGRDDAGNLSGAVWFSYRNPATPFPDYYYKWVLRSVSSSDNPAPRMNHSAVMIGDGTRDTMVIFGGLAGPVGAESPDRRVWRLYDAGGSRIDWRWDSVATVGASGPSARYGHTAFFDRVGRQMIVVGGTTNGTSAIDNTVWAFRFTNDAKTTGSWTQLTVVNSDSVPAARFDHSMEWDMAPRTIVVGAGDVVTDVRSAVLFGGRGSGGAWFNDCWRLLMLGGNDNNVRWVKVQASGATPDGRGGHTGTLDPGTNRLCVYGGETSAGVTDRVVHVLQLNDTLSSAQTWRDFTQLANAATQHTAILDYPDYARLPEIYDPPPSAGGNHWSHASGSNTTLLEEWYPQTFVMPGPSNKGQLFVSGPADSSWKYDPATGTWALYPASPNSGFHGGSAVMYAPGKVMKCGTRDTEVGATAVRTTKWIDLTSTGSPTWQNSDSMALGRVNMNLTLLPTGKVLATGGMTVADNNANSGPRRQPEIWDPALNSGLGAWTGGVLPDALPSSSVPRGYHSTAILLPDGRVLCAGGNGKNIDTAYLYADIFCPPYLFDGDAVAVRPTHSSAPAGHMKWGRTFTIATSRASTINSVCLIRPAATTHAFDMNQRYVPLNFTAATGPSRLLVTAPVDSNAAPPGDYMLFMLDSLGTAASGVPSVATWLKLDRYLGRDSADATVPGTISTLAPDMISPTTIYLTWNSTADDGSLAASGVSLTNDLRFSLSAINSETTWNNATQASGEAAPQPTGSLEEAVVSPLQACKLYHFALRTMDDNLQLSAIPSNFQVSTLCGGGGGGGGASARQAGGGLSALGQATWSGSSAQGQGSTVIIETTPTPAGRWQVVVRSLVSGTDLGLADTNGVILQRRDAEGNWITRAHVAADILESTLGLSAFRPGSRTLCLGNFRLDQVSAGVRIAGNDYILESAIQSGVGDLGGNFVAAGGGVSLAVGDTLALTYAPAGTPLLEPGDWFALISRSAPGGLTAREAAPNSSPAFPARFALHQNQPNPFAAITTIRFDMPVGGMVRLDVFDAQGRRVETLAHRYFPPGFQSVAWNPRATAAHSGPGVYFYRLQAGAFQARRKAMLLP